MSSFSVRRPAGRPRGVRRAPSSSGAVGSGCCSTAAREPSGSCSARRRARRSPRDLHHPLPRGSLPWAPRVAQDVRPARARGAPHDLRARWAQGALRRPAAHLRPPDLPLELVELGPRDALDRDGYKLEAFQVAHRATAIGYALVEEARPGRFDVAAADALGVPFGPARGALQRGEAVALPTDARSRPRTCSGRRGPGGRSRIRGTPRQPTPSSRPRRAQTCWYTRRRSEPTSSTARARPGTRPPPRPRRSRARRGAAPRADPHLAPLLRAGARPGGMRGVPQTVVARDFDVIEVPFAERGEPRLLKRGARPPRGSTVAPE